MDDDRSGDLLARWRAGDADAAAEIFRRYADRLIALARGRLSAKLARRIDPEDVVIRTSFMPMTQGPWARRTFWPWSTWMGPTWRG